LRSLARKPSWNASPATGRVFLPFHAPFLSNSLLDGRDCAPELEWNVTAPAGSVVSSAPSQEIALVNHLNLSGL
jgi:hypothetical protein